MSFALKPPNEIDLATIDVSSFEIWLEAFNDFCTLSKKSMTDEAKCMLFLTVAGISTRTLLKKLKTDVTKFKDIEDDLKKYIRPVKSIVTERYKFFTCKQVSGENVQEFGARLRGLASSCDFEDASVDSVTNQLVRDQLILGVSDSKITENLLQKGDISLEKTLHEASCIEQAGRNLAEIRENQTIFAVAGKSMPQIGGARNALTQVIIAET